MLAKNSCFALSTVSLHKYTVVIVINSIINVIFAALMRLPKIEVDLPITVAAFCRSFPVISLSC